MDFAANKISADLNKSYVEMQGDVSFRNQQVSAHSIKGEIFLENYSKKLKYYALFDDVVVKQKLILNNGQTIERTAYAEKLEGTLSEGKIVLSGAPRVVQNKETIEGNIITLTEGNEVVEVEDASSSFEIKN